MVFQGVATGCDDLALDADTTDRRCERCDGTGQVVRRGEAVPDEEHTQVGRLSGASACAGKCRRTHRQERESCTHQNGTLRGGVHRSY